MPLWDGAVIVPYASGKRWTLYGASCLDVLAAGLIPADASVIGDPPYGMDWDVDTTRFSGGSPESQARRGCGNDQRLRVANDDRPFDPAPWLDFPRVVLFGANHFGARLPVGTTLVWLKRNPPAFGSFLSDGEIAWMKGGHGVYAHLEVFAISSDRVHPNEKPPGLLEWCMTRAKVPPDGVVFDGWAGSGSCGVAALRTGRSYIGCEIEPVYLPIIARRLAQAEADGVQASMFAPRP